MQSREVQWKVAEGEAYGLVFSFRALEALKDAWGCASDQEVGEKLQTLTQGMDFAKVRDLIWAAMRSNHREKTQDDVMDILDRLGFDALPDIAEMLSQLVAASMPAQKASRAGPRKVATASR